MGVRCIQQMIYRKIDTHRFLVCQTYPVFKNYVHRLDADYRGLGDPQGVSLVANICEPQRKDKSGHVFVPQVCHSNMDPETLTYLSLKRVFDLPSDRASGMMMQTYFSHVHPFFPVIEAKSFVEEFENKSHKLSIHLLWSMYLAAANVSFPPVVSPRDNT